ncbi:cytochrome P450, partial [Fistulina hepatica ATCC 64428]
LPPGPKRRLLIGNALEFPRLHSWNKFNEWREQYGDIVYAEVLGKSIVVLNSLDTINDLLEKRATYFTSRPKLVVVGELMSLNEGMPMLPYGTAWKRQRRLANQALSHTSVKKYYKQQSEIVTLFLRDLLSSPESYVEHLRLIVMNVTYGFSAKTPDSLYITEAEECLDIISRYSMPGAFLVDLVPVLKYLPTWFPGASFHKLGREGYNRVTRLITRPLQFVHTQIENGTAPPSLALDCLSMAKAQETGLSAEHESDVRWVTGSMYGANNERYSKTYTAVMNFVLACISYPDVIEKARIELDRVVGCNRLPDLNDRDRLPYVNACVQELYRWRVVVPTSLPRESERDEIYRGYFIPKGTIIIPNASSIAQDHISGISPEVFAPERHMPEVVGEKVAIDPAKYAFGFGRRVCPGRYLGDNSVFLFVANIISTMLISP